MIDVKEKISSVYTAHSKHNFYARKLISSYVLENNRLPLNPFTLTPHSENASVSLMQFIVMVQVRLLESVL